MFPEPALAPSNPVSLPGEIETRLGIALPARNHRVTKSVGCHKRVKPGGEKKKKEKGGWGGWGVLGSGGL